MPRELRAIKANKRSRACNSNSWVIAARGGLVTTAYKESSVYNHPHLRGCHRYVLPDIQRLCAALPPGSRLLDVGCGNGSLAREFSRQGHRVTGVDLSRGGIEIARRSVPEGRFEVLGADRDLLANLDEAPFDMVYSIEVIEHLYDPMSFLEGCLLALRPGGMFLCSTPYHGYLKNLAISVVNGWDHHANPRHEGGHIRFYSKKTLAQSVLDAGFIRPSILGSGRTRWLWKGMILTATKPLLEDSN
jgi:2-polyprenyl-6-hydroxyphenyl methylase/3-demethylubiquinone-9 3-methyltransferase